MAQFVKSAFFVVASTIIASSAQAVIAPYTAWFLDQFSEHHKDAIMMSNLALSKAENTELRAMAQTMVKDQSSEIEQMQAWRTRYFPNVSHTRRSMPVMDMSPLENRQGKAFDLAFIKMMSKHHADGVNMATKAMKQSSVESIRVFSGRVASKQKGEIAELARIQDEISQAPVEKSRVKNMPLPVLLFWARNSK